MTDRWSVHVGFEPKEAAAFWVAVNSIRRRLSIPISVRGLELTALQQAGYYTRPTEQRTEQLWDVISNHPMSTEFAISRFLIPAIVPFGWSLFLDCDMLVRTDLIKLFELADPRYAVMVVKHNHIPNSSSKMDNQVQSTYPRKNWSSVCLFNCEHPSNRKLTIDMVNSLPGRDLHAFCWLKDEEIGELPVEYNYLVGYSHCDSPSIVHFTEGGPWLEKYKDVEYADEWCSELRYASRCMY